MISGGWLETLFVRGRGTRARLGGKPSYHPVTIVKLRKRTTNQACKATNSNRRFFCRGGRGRLRATCGGWDEWRRRGRWRCGCAIIEGLCALARAGAVPEFWV